VPEHSGPSAGVGSLVAATESLRSAAKWMMASAGGVAAALAAGLQLSDLGRLSPGSWRLYAAVAGAAVGLGAVVYMIRAASSVLTHEWITLARFSGATLDSLLAPARASRTDLTGIRDRISESEYELYSHAAPSIAALHAGLRQTNDVLRPSSGASTQEREIAARRGTELRQAARDVVDCANYYATLDLFRVMRTRFMMAATVGVVALGVFAYASNPPAPDPVVQVRIQAGSPTQQVPQGMVEQVLEPAQDEQHVAIGRRLQAARLGVRHVPVYDEVRARQQLHVERIRPAPGNHHGATGIQFGPETFGKKLLLLPIELEDHLSGGRRHRDAVLGQEPPRVIRE
jgi:hypothetical protein